MSKNILPESFSLPAYISTGKGCLKKIISFCKLFGNKGLIVHGKSLIKNGLLDSILADNTNKDIEIITYCHRGNEPTLEDVDTLRDIIKKNSIKWVAGIGGGSVLDLAKAGAGLANCNEPTEIYHEGKTPEKTGLPFIASPTTAGTGSEATTVCVLTNQKTMVKKSIRDPSFIAKGIFMDSSAILSCPKHIIASSGMDAFTQAVESYWSIYSSWLSETFSLKALELLHESLPGAYDNISEETSEKLLYGSFLAGIALSMARLGVVHGIAHPVGSYCNITHGLSCAIILPHAIELNRQYAGKKYEKMCEVIREDMLEFVKNFIKLAGLPQRIQISKNFYDRIIKETLVSGSTAANPKKISENDILYILEKISG